MRVLLAVVFAWLLIGGIVVGCQKVTVITGGEFTDDEDKGILQIDIDNEKAEGDKP